MLSRSEFLRLTAGASAGWFVGGWRPRGAAAAIASAAGQSITARLSRIIQEYDGQGIHRTGTEVDNRSASWLVDQARQAGADARTEPFSLSRVDVHAAYVDIGGRRVDALPLFDAAFTDARGLRGRLAAAGENGAFALVTADAAAISSEGRSLLELRRSGKYQAVIVVTRGAHAGLSPMNAGDFAAPYGAPVLQVSSDERAFLEEQSRAGGDAAVVAHATRTDTAAYNVVATVVGERPELSPVVVMTPRSGWWQCAGERGGGLVCWLEAMRAVRSNRVPRSVLFVASSGHELGHFGLDAFLTKQRDLIKGAAAWIHLGANIGAAGGRARLQASSDEIEGVAADALTRVGAPAPQRVPRGTVPGGEARNIHVGGGRYVSLLGSSPLFHSAADRWPEAVDVAALEKYARALAAAAVTLAASG